MDKTPPKTPGWTESLFGWGTAKKERSKNTFSGASSPPARMPPLTGQLDLMSGQPPTTDVAGYSAVSDRNPRPQFRPPASVSKVSFAPSVSHQSPWRSQTSSTATRINQRTATPGNHQLVSFGGSARKQTVSHQKAVVPTKRRTTRTKYRPSSATLNTHMVAAPPKVVDEIRKSLIAPRDLLPPSQSSHLSLGNVRVLRKGRTLNESHSRLLEAHQRKRRAIPGGSQNNDNLLSAAAAMASPDTKRRRVKFQEQMNDKSLLMSPQSTGSSAGSLSVQSGGAEEPPSLRPHSIDEPYKCIPETGEDHYGVDPTLLRGAPARSIPAFMPPKPRQRLPVTDLIVNVSDIGSSKENPAVSESAIPHKAKKPRADAQAPVPTQNEYWECKNCQTQNNDDESKCTKCQSNRSSKPVASNWGSTFTQLLKGWRCEACRTNNPDMESTQCAACEVPRPGAMGGASGKSQKPTVATAGAIGAGGFTFGNNKAAAPANGGLSAVSAPAPSGGGFNFTSFGGGGSNNGTAGASSGFQMKSVESASSGGEASRTKPPSEKGSSGGFQFGGGQDNSASGKPSSASEFNFGGSTASSETKAAETHPAEDGFKFGGGTSLESKAAQPPPAQGGFSFGGAGTSSESKAAQPAPAAGGFRFGAPSSENKAAQPPPATGGFNFGGAGTSSENKAPQPAPAPGGFSFGVAAATKSQESNPVSTNGAAGFSFGGSETAEIAKEEKTSEGTKAPFVFGNASAKDKDEKAGPPGPSSGFALPIPFGEKKERKALGMPGFAPSDPKSLNSRPAENGGQATGGSFPGPSFGASSIPAPQDLETDSNRPKKRRDETEGTAGPAPAFQFGSSRDSGAPNASAPAAPSFGATTFGAPPAPTPAAAPGPQFGSQAPAGFQFGSSNATGEMAKTPSAPSFGPPGGFGAAPAPSGQLGFGATPLPASGPSFGQSGFGATPAPATGPSFGQAPAPGFGSSANLAPAPFGGISAPSPGFQANFSFGGGGAPAPQPAPGGFGASAPPAFGNQPQSFGAPAPAASSFGGAPPQFGSFPQNGGGGMGQTTPGGMGQSTPGFAAATPGGGFGGGAAPQDAGAFSIGTGGGGVRRRRVIKAKRPK